MDLPHGVFKPWVTNNSVHVTYKTAPKKTPQRSNLISVKSKVGVEYRRYAVPREDVFKFENFLSKVESMHGLYGTPFNIFYSDLDGEMLPINNDDNLAKAIDASTRLKTTHYVVNHPNHRIVLHRPYLKLFLEKKGIPNDFYYCNMKSKRKDNLINMLIPSTGSWSDSKLRIGAPEDFRQVSSIIDADKLPATRRRVVLKRGGSDKPLGFYIRDGTYHRINSQGIIEKNYGIFISRLVPGGLAESTNLLAENDEILEVNGIELGKNKTLDQVRDMMILNSSNLIITTRPAKSHIKYSPMPNNQFRARNKPSIMDFSEDYVRHYMK